MFKSVEPKKANFDIGQFPHCDARVLHAPGECEYCDMHPEWQALRERWGIAFTGYEPDPAKKELPCPATNARGDAVNRWGGNVARPATDKDEETGTLLASITLPKDWPDEGILEFRTGPKMHRCMRCLEEFECPHGDNCIAKYDVLPGIAANGEFTSHCPDQPDWSWIRARIERERAAEALTVRNTPPSPAMCNAQTNYGNGFEYYCKRNMGHGGPHAFVPFPKAP